MLPYCGEQAFEIWEFIASFQDAAVQAEVVQVGEDTPLRRIAIQHPGFKGQLRPVGYPVQLLEGCDDVGGIKQKDCMVPPQHTDDIKR